MWAFVGSYGNGNEPGGIKSFRVDPLAASIDSIARADRAVEAGYLVYAEATRSLYAVDERKTDGRGPVGPAASVHAFSFDAASGDLRWRNSQIAPGPFPTYLALAAERELLLCASHGSFEHVERVVPTAGGGWTVEYVYDASTVIAYRLGEDGAIGEIADLQVLTGYGADPNGSLQAGGHAQASPHAHCAALDPSGRFVLVCDKGTDRVLVYRLAERLELASAFAFPPETAPRHVAFSNDGRTAFLTLEIASGVAAMAFDPENGSLRLIDRVRATDEAQAGLNEPAELRLHPNGRFVYVNNRGEDSLAWFAWNGDRLARRGHVPTARSVHPGLAARSFAFDPTGRTILFADRPADRIRLFAIDGESGQPTQVAEAEVSAPVFVAFAPTP
jgi:6-phosphogluconolactonase